jgi:hypothetical protein
MQDGQVKARVENHPVVAAVDGMMPGMMADAVPETPKSSIAKVPHRPRHLLALRRQQASLTLAGRHLERSMTRRKRPIRPQPGKAR